jgi:hypothetical protein
MGLAEGQLRETKAAKAGARLAEVAEVAMMTQ